MNVGGVSSGYGLVQQGLARAGQRTLEAAQAVTEAAGRGDVGAAAEGVINLRAAKVETQAVAAFVRAQDEMIGSVLDLLG